MWLCGHWLYAQHPTSLALALPLSGAPRVAGEGNRLKAKEAEACVSAQNTLEGGRIHMGCILFCTSYSCVVTGTVFIACSFPSSGAGASSSGTCSYVVLLVHT